MQGLYLGLNGAFLDRFSKDSGTLTLLASAPNGMEVMMQEIEPGRYFCLTPGEKDNTFEFFYVIEGSLIHGENDNEVIIKKGDYVYFSDLRQVAHFKTIEPCRLLYLSTQPVFNYINSCLQELVNMVAAVEEKDTCTLNHTQRLQHYALRIGEKLNFTKDRLIALGYAALLHDVGKVNIPAEVLMKPGPLTSSEFDLVKKHPVDGRNMVQKTFLSHIGDIVEQHHERLDGSGYPHGLKNNDILLEARIVAVVDCYDAMISDRPYRKGKDPQVAIEELISLSGQLYDSMIVDTLVRLLIEDGVIKSDAKQVVVSDEYGCIVL